MNDGQVVVDTSALYALISTSDRFHGPATVIYRELLQAKRPLWVTSYALVEFGVIVERRMGFEALKSFYDAVQDTIETLWVDRARHEDAWNDLTAEGGRGLNFVDRTVLLAAKELGARIFTFDRGFRRRGMILLPEVST